MELAYEATAGEPVSAPKIIYLGGLAMGGEPGLIARWCARDRLGQDRLPVYGCPAGQDRLPVPECPARLY